MSKICCLVLGETGVGKSSFINAITKVAKEKECKVGDDMNACTVDYDIQSTIYNNSTYIFIDTPGLNDAKGDKDNIKQIKRALVEHPEFSCILILMKLQDKRLPDSMVKTLQKYMDCFPLKDFWKHVIIVRTNSNLSNPKFEKEKKKIKDSIVKCIQHEDFKDFRCFMNTKNITLPDYIREYYVDCDNDDEPEERFKSNEKEFNSIFKAIRETKKMFKEIKANEFEEVIKTAQFDKIIFKKTIIYIDQYDNKIIGETYVDKEKEISNYPVVKKEKIERAGTIKSECRKKKVHMHCYETCIYDVNGKQVRGSECLVSDYWKVK